MKSLNKVQVIGNLGTQPEIKKFDNGSKVANLSVATNEDYTDRNGNRIKQVEWHRVNVTGKAVEVAEKYLKKGDKVYLEGKLKTRSYLKNNVTHYITELICFQILMLGGQSEQPAASNSPETETIPNTPEEPKPSYTEVEDDLPF